jgi:hypothetical protein
MRTGLPRLPIADAALAGVSILSGWRNVVVSSDPRGRDAEITCFVWLHVQHSLRSRVKDRVTASVAVTS